jgi:nucleotide-binding universal stress UspA family protein
VTLALFEHVVCGVDGSEAAATGVELATALAGDDAVTVVELPEDTHDAADRLLDELRASGATLAVVGSSGHSRALGIARGAVATTVVHEAPCSVLVAHELRRPPPWPRRVVVGSDGSAEGEHARGVARELARRLGADVFEIVDALNPVAELTEASEDADLVVVGSRGLRGIRALGSVSERVAHDAHCPVLVVRAG